MAWDFTLSGGNKTEKTSRTRSSVKQASGATLTQSVASEAKSVGATPTANPLEAIGEGLSSFFGGVVKQERIDNEELEKKRNEEAIFEAQRRVWADPEGAAEAYENNDHSKFLDDEFSSRKIVMDTYMGVLGASAAQADYESTGRAFINSLSSNADPVQAYQEYIAKKVEGAHDKYAQQFAESSGTLAKKDIVKFQNARYKMVVDQAVEHAGNVADVWWAGSSSAGADGPEVQAMFAKLFAGVPVPPVMRSRMAREALGKSVRKAAIDGNKAALEFIHNNKVSPGKTDSPTWDDYFSANGLSIPAGQNKKMLENRANITGEQRNKMEGIRERLVLGTLTPGGALKELQDLYKGGTPVLNPMATKIRAEAAAKTRANAAAQKKQDKIDDAKNKEDIDIAKEDHARWLYQRQELKRISNAEAKAQKAAEEILEEQRLHTSIANVMSGRLSTTSLLPGQRSDVIKILEKSTNEQFAQAYRMTPAEAAVGRAALQSAGYISEARKEQYANDILGKNVNLRDREAAMKRLLDWPGANMDDILPSNRRYVRDLVEAYRQSPDAMRPVLKQIGEAADAGLNPAEVWNHLPGKFSKADFTSKVVKAIPSKIFSDMTTVMKNRIIATASVMATGSSVDAAMTSIVGMFSEENLQGGQDAMGAPVITQRNARGDSYNIPEFKQIESGFELLYGKYSERLSGTSGLGGGLIVHGSEIAAGQMPGGFIFTNQKEVDDGLPLRALGWDRTVTKTGTIQYTVPPAPKEGESLVRSVPGHSGLFIVHEDGVWTTRFSPDRDLMKSPPKVARSADTATRLLFGRNQETARLERRVNLFTEHLTETVTVGAGREAISRELRNKRGRKIQGRIDDLNEKIKAIKETMKTAKQRAADKAKEEEESRAKHDARARNLAKRPLLNPQNNKQITTIKETMKTAKKRAADKAEEEKKSRAAGKAKEEKESRAKHQARARALANRPLMNLRKP